MKNNLLFLGFMVTTIFLNIGYKISTDYSIFIEKIGCLTYYFIISSMLHLWNNFKLDFLNKTDGPEYVVGKRKIGLICLPRKKNLYENVCLWKPVYWMKEQLEGVKPSWYSTAKCVMLTISIHPPHFTCLICGESYIYWVLRNNSWVHTCSVSVTWSCHTGSHSIIIIVTRNIISLLSLTQRKSKLNLLFKLSLCLFLVRPLGFLELFSNSHIEHLWPLWMRFSPPLGHHEDHLIIVD